MGLRFMIDKKIKISIPDLSIQAVVNYSTESESPVMN